MEIVRTDDFDIQAIVGKWTPILDNVLDREKGYTDEQIEEICRYCEYHSINDLSSITTGQMLDNPPYLNQPPMESTTLLPLSLKIISKLNLEGKKFIATPGPRSEFIEITSQGARTFNKSVGTMEVSIPITRDDLSIGSLELVQAGENTLVDMLVEKMNLQLKYHDSILFYLGAQSISVFAEATFTPRMLLRSRYAMMERNDEQEAIYRVERTDDGVVTNVEILDIDEEQYIKTTSDDGEDYWINISEGVDADQRVLTNVYSEKQVVKMIDQYQKVVDDSNQSLILLRNII